MKRSVLAVVVVFAGVLVTVAEAPRRALAAAPIYESVCPAPEPGYARCFAEVLRSAPWPGNREASAMAATPHGFSPEQIKTAYGFPMAPRAGRGKTIAIVGAFDAPTVERDLNTYSRQFRLPLCTTGNGCFKKLNARGETPAFDELWSLESTLDTQIAHAIAPGAKILLVQASSNNFVDLLQAFQVATQNAAYVSSSWGGDEFAQQTLFDPLFNVAGVSDFFAAGDVGAPRGSWPAYSPEVIGVGGTRLVLNANDVKRKETAWTNGGGGCSTIYAANAAQNTNGLCAGMRALPDLAANADPETGFAIYLGTPFNGVTGWVVLAGTSASTPLMAARAAITGVAWDAAYVYSAQRKFFDVVYGNNGFRAQPGFDLASGRGRFKA